MPFVILALGIVFVIVSINNTQGDLWALLKSEFTGSNNFVVFASAIVVLGLAGYVKPIRPVTEALIGLVLLVVVLANRGVFAQFNAALRNPVQPAAPPGNVSIDSLQFSTAGQAPSLGNIANPAANATPSNPLPSYPPTGGF